MQRSKWQENKTKLMGEKETHSTLIASVIRFHARDADQIFITIFAPNTQTHTHSQRRTRMHARTSHQHSILLCRRRRRNTFSVLFFVCCVCCWRLFLVYFYIKCWIFVVSRQHFRAHAHTGRSTSGYDMLMSKNVHTNDENESSIKTKLQKKHKKRWAKQRRKRGEKNWKQANKIWEMQHFFSCRHHAHAITKTMTTTTVAAKTAICALIEPEAHTVFILKNKFYALI